LYSHASYILGKIQNRVNSEKIFSKAVPDFMAHEIPRCEIAGNLNASPDYSQGICNLNNIHSLRSNNVTIIIE
jgi:hypothetical protein